jgi:uncharacterized protein YhaN
MQREINDLKTGHAELLATIGRVDANIQVELQRIIEQGTPITRVLRGDVDRIVVELQELRGIRDAAVLRWVDLVKQVAEQSRAIEDLTSRTRRLRDDLNAHEESDIQLLRDRINREGK